MTLKEHAFFVLLPVFTFCDSLLMGVQKKKKMSAKTVFKN